MLVAEDMTRCFIASRGPALAINGGCAHGMRHGVNNNRAFLRTHGELSGIPPLRIFEGLK